MRGQALRQAVPLQAPLERGVVPVVESGRVGLAGRRTDEGTSC